MTIAVPTIEAPENEAFIIDTEEKANWAINLILSKHEELARLEAQYAAMKKATEAEIASAEARFLLPLEDYARSNPPAKGKTLKLLRGNLSFRTVNGGFRVTDKDAVIAWEAEHRPHLDGLGLVETVEVKKVNTDAVKAYAASTGEAIPGVEYVEDRESFSVKPAKAAKGDE